MKQNNWIPCKVFNQNYIPQLKDFTGYVLVTVKRSKLMVREQRIEHGFLANKKYNGEIIAYMWLPEPYRQGEGC